MERLKELEMAKNGLLKKLTHVEKQIEVYTATLPEKKAVIIGEVVPAQDFEKVWATEISDTPIADPELYMADEAVIVREVAPKKKRSKK